MTSSFDETLSGTDILVGLRAGDKRRLLEKLAHRAALASGIDPLEVLAALARREELGSTGLGGGVALPHARLPSVRRAYALLAILSQPIPFDAIDDRPVDVVVLLLLPSPSQAHGLDTLAYCARRLRDPEIVHLLRHAPTADRARLFFTGQYARSL